MSPRPAARTASEGVAEQIREQIATGRLKPGDMLPSETALLRLFLVARPTMREALRALESDGLIRIQRGIKGGARVQEPELARLARRVGLHLQLRGAKLEDLLAAQAIFHPGAVALAATARTTDDLALLREQIERVRRAASVGQFADAASDFLDLLSSASHNPVLALVSNLTTELLSQAIGANRPLREGWSSGGAQLVAYTVEQYTTVVDHIEAQDPDGAEQFWRNHLVTAHTGAEATSSPLTVYRSAPARHAPLRTVEA